MMRRQVVVIDTSIMCCWLNVPGKETAGPKNDTWDHDRVEDLLAKEQAGGCTFVLPLATLIETGNHISQATGNRYELATTLANYLLAATNEDSPWAAFTEQSVLWDAEPLRHLAAEWPRLASARFSLGDATIKAVAEFYASAGMKVRILTGDAGLKAYEPVAAPATPRRRR